MANSTNLVILLFTCMLYWCSDIVSGGQGKNVTLALLQMPLGSPIANIEKYLLTASNSKSDIAIFPSSFLNGPCSSWITTTQNWCINYNLSIAISCNNTNTNSVESLLIDKTGTILLNYTKPKRNGQNPNTSVATLPISNNNIIKVGILLEDDIFYPEIARDLMLQGCHLILYMTKGNLSQSIDDILLYTRGSENLNIIARVNRASSPNSITDDNGRSAVGSNLGGSGSPPNGNLFFVSPVDNLAQIIISKFDINYVNHARSFNHMGDNFRRPFHYRTLCNLSNNKPESKHNLHSSNGSDILIKIAALQMIPGQTVDENIEIADKFVHSAALMGADIVVMPEMFSVGYLEIWPKYVYGNMSQLDKVYDWLDLSQTKYDIYVEHFRNLSIELEISIGASFLELRGDSIPPFNSVILFDKKGNELYTYSKVHTVGDDWNEALTSAGYTFYMNELDLLDERGKVNIGSIICYDQEFPESVRILNELNTEIVLKSNACRFSEGAHWRLRSRAIENKLGVVMANYAYPTIGANGNLMNGESCAYDWNGNVLIIANQSEQVVMSTFNVTKIREERLSNNPMHQIKRLCDFQRQPDFVMNNDYFRVSGCTV
eukprot:452635_1